MSALSLEADKLFPEENFDDIVPQSPPNFRMSSMFRFVSGRPRSPSPQRKPKVILRALLVAEDSDWPEDAQLQISEAMAGRESEVTESLKEPGYKAFWGAAYKRVKEEDMQKPFNEVVLSPFLTTVRAGKLVPGLECSAICGPILANHVEDLLPRGMLTEPMETFLVDDAMLGAPTEFTVMIKIVPQQDSETDTKTDTTEPRLSEDSFIGTAKNGFKFVGPLNMKERSQAATALQTQWRGKHAKKKVTDLVHDAPKWLNISDEIPVIDPNDQIFRLEKIMIDKIIDKETKETQAIKYKSLSDGEHQFNEVIGSMMLMDEPGCLLLFDEPDTHFNPKWRSNIMSLFNEMAATDYDHNDKITKVQEQEVIIKID